MTELRFRTADGATQAIDAKDGDSVMESAVRNDVAGIIGECGGSMACGTCRVTVTADVAEIVGPPGDFESDVLEGIEPGRLEKDRLSCQITVGSALEGICFDVAEEVW